MNEVEPLYKMLNSENQIMLSNILDSSMDQEMIHQSSESYESQPLYEMLNSKEQIMLSNILDNLMNQEMVPGPSEIYESQNPIEEFELQIYVFLVSPTKFDEHNSVTKPLSIPKRDEWLKAMKEELESMKTNKVWTLVDLPKER